MKHSKFAKALARYHRYDNRALVVALAEAYGRRDSALASVARIRNYPEFPPIDIEGVTK